MNTSQTTDKNNINIDLSPYYIKGLPILLFLAIVATLSLSATAIYHYCF